MILDTFIVMNLVMLSTKMIYTKIVDKHAVYSRIVNEGLYHVTTAENAEKILESGYINPSSSFLSLGKKKAFFFAGIPSYIDLCTNTANQINQYSFKAIKVKINHEELAQFKCRQFNDDSIVYEGKYQLPKDRVSIEDLVIDVNSKNEIIVREKGKDENYNPKENPQLLKLVKQDSLSTGRNLLKAYAHEVKNLSGNIKNLVLYANDNLSKKLGLNKLHVHGQMNFDVNKVGRKK